VTAPHFFVERLSSQGRVTLSPGDSRHALRSLRLRPGEGVTVADGAGIVGVGVLRGEEDGLAVIEVRGTRRVVRPLPMVSVALAPPKGDRLSWAVQKLAEIGVDELLLMRTERSVRTWEAEREERVLIRLREVAREAAMQSRRPFALRMEGGATLDDALAPREGGHVVMLSETASVPFGAALPADPPPDVRLMIGPEGGFSSDEVAAARGAGAAVASLGDAILRTETAAMVAASIVLSRYDRLG
jgi:16S rRNA (uracil1498-N3)-methyltransferase